MDILELVGSRHSVRSFLDKPIEEEKRNILSTLVDEVNKESGQHIAIYFDEPKAYSSLLSHYGKFKNVKNYIALIGEDEEKLGYYGEKLVLKAQEIGLNTCWVALTYDKRKVKFEKRKNEKLYCTIALGYGENQGFKHKSKTYEQVVEIEGSKPDYFDEAVESCLLAPTAINQQKFLISLKNGEVSIDKVGLGPCIKIDLGIVKYHFDIIKNK